MLEQEARIESEIRLKHILEQEKSRKSKDAEDYRQFLLGQMQEKKEMEERVALRDKIFLHHRQLADNEKLSGIKDQVDKVDVTATEEK